MKPSLYEQWISKYPGGAVEVFHALYMIEVITSMYHSQYINP